MENEIQLSSIELSVTDKQPSQPQLNKESAVKPVVQKGSTSPDIINETLLSSESKETCCTRFSKFMKKYFCYGQIKEGATEDDEKKRNKGNPPEGSSWFYKTFIFNRPNWVSTVLPLTIVWLTWLIIVSTRNLWWVFRNTRGPGVPGWKMTLTMIFGSFIAGATSEGGGSIAYPVMTLILGIRSSVSRDFSLMIQSVGMTSGAFTIIYGEILVEKTAILYGSIGSTAGICIGLWQIAPRLPDAWSKMLFVSVWLAFAINLFLLNRVKKRKTFLTLQDPNWSTKSVLILVGFVGGVLSSIAGSGVDICVFSILTLLYRLSEKTATPTSVVLMAINTCVGFIFQGAILRRIESETWIYFCAAAISVPFGAPIGAFVSSFLHRQVLACFVYFTDLSQFVLASVVTKEMRTDKALVGAVVGIVVGALLFFLLMRYFGYLYLKSVSAKHQELKEVKEEQKASSDGSVDMIEVLRDDDVN